MKNDADRRWAVMATGLILAVTPLTGATNDNFANSEPLGNTFPQTIVADLSEATLEPGEPLGGLDGNASVWFLWTPTDSGWYSARSAEEDEVTAGRSVVLGIYEGDDFENLRDVGISSSSFGSAIFAVEAGREYHIAVAGDRLMSQVDVSLETALFDENHDAFEDRVDLGSAENLTLIVDPRAGTPEPSRLPEGLLHKGTLWWQWTALEDRVVRLTSSRSLGKAVYSGETLEELTPVETVYGNGPTHFRAMPGVAYAIAAYSLNSTYLSEQVSIRFEALEPISNDDFADAIDLGSETGVEVDQHAMFSSAEEGEPGLNSLHPNVDLENTLWWKWTAPEPGLYEVETIGHTSGHQVNVYRGQTLADLEDAAVAENPQNYYVQAEAGESFFIQGLSRGTGTRFKIEKIPSAVAAHDQFINARDLGEEVSSAGNGFNGFATTEAGEPPTGSVLDAPDWVPAGNSLWWQWTAPHDGLFRVNTMGTDFPEHVRVFEGEELDTLEVAHLTSGILLYEHAVAAPFSKQARRFAYFMGEAGIRYHVSIQGSEPGVSGNVDFTIEELPLAENVSVETARDLPSEATVVTEPISMLAETWWRWTSPGDGLLKLSTPDYIEARTDLYREVVSEETRVRSGEVEAGVTYLLGLSASDLLRRSRRLVSSKFDPFVLRLDLAGQHSNDDFANAIVLGERDYASLNAERRNASAEPGEPDHGGEPASNSVWWRWTAPRDGWIRLSSWANIGVYTGDRLDALRAVPLMSSPFEQMFFATAQTDYAIAVDSPVMPLHTSLSYSEDPASNDLFSDRFDLGTEIPVGSVLFAELGTLEPPESGYASVPEDSFWWSWTAMSDGPIALRVQSEQPHSEQPAGEILASVFTGQSLDELVPVAEISGDSVATVVFEALAGTEYSISVRTKAFLGEKIRLDLFREGDSPATETILVEDPFRDWIAQFPNLPEEQRGPDARPTFDGIPNLLKYAVGLDPSETHRAAPHPLEVILREDHIALRYEVINEVIFYPPYEAIIEQSVNGIDWAPVPERNHLERIDSPTSEFGSPPEASLFGSRFERRLPLQKETSLFFRLCIVRR